MAYATLADVKEEGSFGNTVDDRLLQQKLTNAQAMIDNFCNRHFEAVAATRSYNRFYAGIRGGSLLYLDSDLLTLTGLTNGNGAAIPTDGSGCWLEPRNEPPYGVIRLKSAYVFTLDVDGDITVTGTWGFTATPPADIQEATVQLANYLYRLRDSQVFDVTADMSSGQLTIPKGVPVSVMKILNNYRRPRINL
jgi:hypothetical protein